MDRSKQKEVKEQLKRDKFNELCQKMHSEGYKEKVITISALKANIMALVVTLPILSICIVPYILRHKEIQFSGTINMVLFASVIGIIAHELIHGITWALYCENKWKAISFGIIWEYLTPYCTCNECLSFKSYLLGGIMPTIVLGVIPYVAALLLGSSSILIFSMIFIVGGGGDLYMAWLIRTQKDSVLIDHPYMIGCVAFKK